MIPINEARVGLVSLRHWWCTAQWQRVFSRKNWPRDQQETNDQTKRPKKDPETKKPTFWREKNIPGHLDSSRRGKSNFKNKSQKAEHVCLSHTSAILDQYWGQRSQMGSYVMCHYRYTHVLWIHIRGRMNDDREGLLWNKKSSFGLISGWRTFIKKWTRFWSYLS